MKKFLTFIIIITLILIGTVDTISAGSWQPELRIGLYISDTPVKIKTNLDSVFIDSATNNKIKYVQKNTEVIIANVSDKIQIDGKLIDCAAIEIRPRNETDLKNMQTAINNVSYFGGLKIIKMNLGLSLINIVAVEEYLRGVVPKEMSPSWTEDALKAQAVAARTFALKNRKRHESSGYDLCNTSHCQIYNGVAAINTKTDEAITKTYGEVLSYNGKLIEAAFHADSGGMTENAVDVWGTDYQYLRAVAELDTKTEFWTVKIPLDKFSNSIAAANYKVGKVKSIKSSKLVIGKSAKDRSDSGRVKTVKIVGDKGEVTISGTDMRMIFGLNSTLFEIAINGNEIVINGYGRGHGVGMSQMGAQNFAKHNYTYDKILAHYYKESILKRLY